MPVRWWIALSVPPVGFVLTMIAFSTMSRDYRSIPKDLGLELMVPITLGLAVASALYGRAVGRVRRCEKCDATWVEMEQLGETQVSTDYGSKYGKFTEHGWKNGSTWSSRTRYRLTCRKCGHQVERVLRSKSRS